MAAALEPVSRWAKIHWTVGCGCRVGVQVVQLSSPAGVGGVGVRTGVNEAVSVGWSAAEVPVLVAGLGPHGHGGAEPGAEDFPAGLLAQQHHQSLVHGTVEVDRPVGFRQPQLYSVGGQRSDDVGELVVVEGSFVFADDHRVEPPIGVGESVQQRGGLGALGPGQPARAANVEELRDDSALSGDRVPG